MSDPRRRRQIKTPSGPRKKATPDLSKYKMQPPRTGRPEVPKPQPKPDPSQQRSRGGQQDGKRGGQRGGPRRQNNRGQQGRQQRPEPEALKNETWARIIEHDTKTGVATAMAEKTLAFCRVKVKGNDVLSVNQRIYIGKDRSKRQAISTIVGMAHFDKMSNMARQDMEVVIGMFIEEHSQYFVEEFYNKAGYMSLKVHAFELFNSVGKPTAQKMVKAREKVGAFASMAEFNALTNTDGIALLKSRFLVEIRDKSIQPRLTELLLPVEA